MKNRSMLAAGLLITTAISGPALAASETFTVISGSHRVGHLKADQQGKSVIIDYDYKDNGRGPTIAETLTVDDKGFPVAWTIKGATTFGNKVDERFVLRNGRAEWTDATGKSSARVTEPSLYIGQGASAWSLGLYARALLNDPDQKLPVLPGGTIKLSTAETITVAGQGGARDVTAYALTGVDMDPYYVLLDGSKALFAFITPDFVIVREGYEAEEKRLRALAEKLSTERYVSIQKEVAQRFDAPVRITNVRIFDPTTKALTEPRSVVVHGKMIASIEPVDSPATPGEVLIDGAGGTLVAGMYEMHGHLSQDDALRNIAAGVTSIRDLGNDNAVLDTLIERIEDGSIAGPRIIRSGFLEGRSPFSANSGIVVDSQAKALEAVRWYAARGYWQTKIYNSMNPAWVQAIVAESHRLGLRVAGHVPAFSNADAMIAAGYDEMTHINQFMLGWVLTPEEDTRSLLRLTAMKRFQTLDLNSPQVQRTMDLMVQRKVAIDPTVGIHEMLTLNRNGQVPPGAVDYFDHMPVGYQRDLKQALSDTSAPGDDAAYRAAFEKIIATIGMLHKRGVLILPGTDSGGAFTYHRELELYVRAGMTNEEVLKRATYDMARYMGQDQSLGSIEKGKLADFFLIPGDPVKDLKAIKAISMVVKDGTGYFPSDIYDRLGIKPFAAKPVVTLPSEASVSPM